ncbi:MAG: Gx transporter family protein [Lachnospiraceae bacterium]|nr:Gx transporter family protein [Lachnospiraceae bacterium]
MKVKTAYMGLLLAFALILSYIETLIPLQAGIPGIKLGLANLAVILAFYLFGYREALLVTIVKALLSGFLFGNLTMIIYSLSGALFSFLIMAFMVKSRKFHLPVISISGGVMHNIGQLVIAYLVIDTYGIFYYVPILLLAGAITGFFIGITASFVMPYIKNVIERGSNL